MRIGYKAIRVLITYPRSDNLSVYEPELPIWKPLQNLRGPTTMPVGGKLSLTGLRDDTPNHIGHHGAAGAEGAGGTRSPAAVPVGGGRARAGIMATRRTTRQHARRRRCGGRRRVRRAREGLAAVPVGGGGAWPGFEATRRAKLAARTARGRAAAHGHTKQPGPAGARNTRGATATGAAPTRPGIQKPTSGSDVGLRWS